MPKLLESVAEKRAKRAEDFPQFFGAVNLTNIRQNIGEILKLIGRDGIFREYTLHDANHIDSMLGLGEANLQYAALILRSADVLQIQRRRVPTVLYKLIDPSNPKSQEEWAKQSC